MRVRWLPFGCFLAVLVVLSLTALGLWALYFQRTTEHRFRITIDVETPQGPKQGSSVWSVTCTAPFSGGGWSVMTGGCSTVGEAVFVDLGQGRNLVGLVAHDDIAARAFEYVGVPRDRNGNMLASWYSYAAGWRGARVLTGKNIPALVTFSDLSDPATGRIIPATDAGFASVFGADYRLASIALEIVSVGLWPFNLVGLWGTPVSRGIEKHITWMDDPAVIDNPGWMRLPAAARNVIEGLRRPYRS